MLSFRAAALAATAWWIVGTAAAQPADSVARLSCTEASQTGIARQSWRKGGAPFGLAYEKWTEQEFGVLRSRVAACAPRDVGLLRYIDLLNSQQKSAVGRLTPAENNERSVAEDFSKRIEAIHASASSFDELNALCAEIRRSALPEHFKSALLGECFNKLEHSRLARTRANELRAEQQGRVELRRIVAEIEAMPPSRETIQHLRNMLQNNRYRLPQLGFSEQNELYMYLNRKLGPLEAQMVDYECKAVVEKIKVPTELQGAVIDDSPMPMTLVRFLCAAVLGTGKVAVRSAGDDRYDVAVDDTLLTFELGRLLQQQNAFVGAKSPLPGGIKALRLVEVRGPKGSVPFGRGFATRFDSQFTPALSAYLTQSERATRN